MSKVTYKNAIIRTLTGAIAQGGPLPHGTRFDITLKDGRIDVDITAAPFDCMKPGVIETRNGMFSIRISLMAGDTNQTDEANKLIADVKALIAALGPPEAPVRVHVGSAWMRAQGNRTPETVKA